MIHTAKSGPPAHEGGQRTAGGHREGAMAPVAIQERF
jgi:hypothetical protein